MTFHAMVAYLNYLSKARGRHGIHSPFVYDFIEHVLLESGPIERKYIVQYPNLALRFENIMSRIAAYYQYRTVISLPLKKDVQINDGIDMFLLNGEQPKQWLNMFHKYCSLLKKDGMAVATDIHKTPENTAAWNNLCKAPPVTMSIDLYGIGLLLFKDEFKGRQHFILRY